MLGQQDREIRELDRCSVASADDLLRRLMADAERRYRSDQKLGRTTFHYVATGCAGGPCVVSLEACTAEVEGLYDTLDVLAEQLRPDLAVWEEPPGTFPLYWLTVEYPDGRMVDWAAAVEPGSVGDLGEWYVHAEGDCMDGERRPMLPHNLARARAADVWT